MAKKKTKTSKKPVKKAAKKTLKKKVLKPVKKKTVKKVSIKKAAVKKPAAPPPDPLPWRHALPGEILAGVVDDFFSHLSVITLTLQAPLKVGDKIHVRGHTTDMTEAVASIQINHQPVLEAKTGDPVGIKAVGKCRAGDYLYKVG